MNSYSEAQQGMSFAEIDQFYQHGWNEQNLMLISMCGGIISDRLLYGRALAPLYSEQSTLDMLERDGWMSPNRKSALY